MRFRDLASKRVAILGLGREGQAVWRQIRRRYPEIPIELFAESGCHDGFTGTLDPSLDQCHFGPLDVDHLKQFEVLVRSAGISPHREELQQLRSLGVRFTTASNLWFAEYPDARTICITGTMGKSTTAALTAHLLTCAGINVCLSGNIGRPMLDCDSEGVDWWVIELSSYQLSDLVAKPDLAMILNLSDEHIDWHGGSESYRADKLRLTDMAAGLGLIANAADPVLAKKLAVHENVSWFNGAFGWQAEKDRVLFRQPKPGQGGGEVIANTTTALLQACDKPAKRSRMAAAPVSLPGEHNMQNLAAALTVVDMLNFKIPDLDQALAAFTGLPHRLQLIGEINGIKYIDDSISTTPVSVMAALRTTGASDVVLLLGGLDRGLGWDDFALGLTGHPPAAIITMPDNGPKIYESLRLAGVNPPGGLHSADGLFEAVKLAQRLVPEGGCILLSPGAPSFPHFRDFEDR